MPGEKQKSEAQVAAGPGDKIPEAGLVSLQGVISKSLLSARRSRLPPSARTVSLYPMTVFHPQNGKFRFPAEARGETAGVTAFIFSKIYSTPLQAPLFLISGRLAIVGGREAGAPITCGGSMH